MIVYIQIFVSYLVSDVNFTQSIIHSLLYTYVYDIAEWPLQFSSSSF